MRFALPLALVAAPALAFADDGGRTEAPRPDTAKDVPIIGGAAAGSKWPDAVAVLYGGVQECTGTLIAPNVVITAGHCVAGGAPNSVLIGASALSRKTEGETISVMKSIEYPRSQTSIDIGVLILRADSKFPPRPIAAGWARWDIINDAPIELVGFGTTDRNGNVETDDLLEAKTTITDYNCSKSLGCNASAQPDGELGAGGMGIDTCPGDSGGPVYLLTDYGDFLAGVTSRSYDNAIYACGEGGIYGRPDKIVDWISEQTQATIAVGPTPTAEPIDVVVGDAGESQITHNDPKSESHTYAIKTQPTYGKAAVSDSGTVRVCAGKDFYGLDHVVVTVTDANNPMRTADMKLAVNILDGDPADDCDETAFGEDSGGCCSASRDARGSILLAAFVLLSLRRRRRSR